MKFLKNLRTYIYFLIFFVGLFFSATNINASTFKWDFSSDGEWETYTNWKYQTLLGGWSTPGGDYPDSDDDVEISGDNEVTIKLTSDITIKNLTIGKSDDKKITIDLNGHTLSCDSIFLHNDITSDNKNANFAVIGNGKIETNKFDFPNRGTAVYSVNIGSDSEFYIKNNFFVNTETSANVKTTFSGSGQLYIPKCGANVDYGESCVDYTGLSNPVKTTGSANYYSVTSDEANRTFTLTRNGTNGVPVKYPYKAKIITSSGTTFNYDSGTFSESGFVTIPTSSTSTEFTITPSASFSAGDALRVRFYAPDGSGLLLGVVTVQYTECTWIGGTDSNWNESSNWLSGAIPSATDNVSIPTVIAGCFYPKIDTSVSAKSISVERNAELTVLSSGTLSVSEEFLIEGSADIKGNTTAGQMMNDGILSVDSCTLKINNGDFISNERISLSNSIVESVGEQIYKKEVDFSGNNSVTLKTTSSTSKITFNDDLKNVSDSPKVILESNIKTTKDITIECPVKFTNTQTITTDGKITFNDTVSLTTGELTFKETGWTSSSDTVSNSSIEFQKDVEVKTLTANMPVNMTSTANITSSNEARFIYGLTASSYLNLVSTKKAIIYKSNTISEVKIDNSTLSSSSTVKFEGGKTQTITAFGDLKGNSSTNRLILDSTDSTKWNVTTTSTAFSGTNSFVSINNSDSATELEITPSNSKINEGIASSTTKWFSYKYYWFGKTDSKWNEPTNWAINETGTLFLDPSDSAPDYSNDISEIVIVDNDTFDLDLTTSSITDLKIKSLEVKTDKNIKFGGAKINISESFENNGNIYLYGNQYSSIVLPTDTTKITEKGTWRFFGGSTGTGIVGNIKNLDFNEVVIEGKGYFAKNLNSGGSEQLALTAKKLYFNVDASNSALGSEIAMTGSTTLNVPEIVLNTPANIDTKISLDYDLVFFPKDAITGKLTGSGSLLVNGNKRIEFKGSLGESGTELGNLTFNVTGTNGKVLFDSPDTIYANSLKIGNANEIEFNGNAEITDNIEIEGNIFLNADISLKTLNSTSDITLGKSGSSSTIKNKDTTVRNLTIETPTLTVYSTIGENVSGKELGSIDVTADSTFYNDIYSSSTISVDGTTSFSKAASPQTINSVGNQTYTKAVTLLQNTTIKNSDGDIIFGNLGTTEKVKTNSNQLYVHTNSSYKAIFYGGFDDATDLKIIGNADIYEDNEFTKLDIDNSTISSSSTVNFEGGKTQTINAIENLKGSASYNLTLGNIGSSKWKVYFPTNILSPVASLTSVEYVKVKNSTSIIPTTPEKPNPLKLRQESNILEDFNNTALTTTNWFQITDNYYWYGTTNTDWEEVRNWKIKNPLYPISSSDEFIDSPDIPDYENETSNIYIVENEIDIANDIKILSLYISTDTIFDLSNNNLKVSKLYTDGRVRISENPTISLSTIPADFSNITINDFETTTNIFTIDENSTIEYYGTSINTSLSWGIYYQNLEFSNGYSVSDTRTITVNNKTLIANDDGNNIDLKGDFKNTVQIGNTTSQGGNVKLTSTTNTFIKENAKCTTLELTSTKITLEGNVETTSGSTTTGQLYHSPVEFKQDTILTGIANSFINFEDDVQGNTYKLEIANIENSEFNGNVINVDELTINENAKFENTTTQTISTIGNQTYKKSIIVNSNLTLNAKTVASTNYDKDIELNGISSGTGKIIVNSKNANLFASDYITNGTQTYNATTNLKAPTISGTFEWNGTSIKTNSTYFDFAGSTIKLKTDLTCNNLYFYTGALEITKYKTLESNGTFSAWGTNANFDDPRYPGSDTRFEFAGNERNGQDNRATLTTDGSGIVNLIANGKFYINGLDLEDFKIQVTDNADSYCRLNMTANAVRSTIGDGTTAQYTNWGKDNQYAVVFNSAIKNCTVTRGFIAAATGTNYQNVTDAGGNTQVVYNTDKTTSSTKGFQFIAPKIEKAYSVYDDVLCLEFNLPLENTNNEINRAIALNTTLLSGGVYINDGAISVSDSPTTSIYVYKDKDCTVPLTNTESNITKIYIKCNSTWNTDATGTSIGDLNSTDRQGNKQNLKINLSMLDGLFIAEHGHTMSEDYGVGAKNSTFDDTEDYCSPVLIKVSAGQEKHTQGTAQKYYDAHNFIEFEYSEPVILGDMDLSTSQSNIQAQSTFSSITEHGGAIINKAGGGIDIVGYASIQNGMLEAGIKDNSSGSWTGTISTDKPHAFYNDILGTTKLNKVRLSIAGYVDIGNPINSYNNWLGYIEKATMISGNITRFANSFITDQAINISTLKNELDIVSTTNHPLPQLVLNTIESTECYGQWDISAPVFAPYVNNSTMFFTTPDSPNSTYEAIGMTNSRGDSYLSKVEIHILDNERAKYTTNNYSWTSRIGWKNATTTIDTPEKHGGSRAFSSTNQTSGGIRYSSLNNATEAFTYKTKLGSVISSTRNFDSTAIDQNVLSNLFYKEGDSTTRTKTDESYIRLSLNSTDLASNLPLRTQFTIYYNPGTSANPKSFITDLAGNRLVTTDIGSSVKTLQSVDVSPPGFTLSLAPIGKNKIYLVFSKKLYFNGYDFDTLRANGTLQSALDTIKSNFTISGFTILNIEYKNSTLDYTSLLLTLDKNVSLSDITSSTVIKLDNTSVPGISGYQSYIQDSMGNYLENKTEHIISDFAINIVKPLYAYTQKKINEDEEDWFSSQKIYGENIFSPETEEYAVHDFTQTGGNYSRLREGRDIIMQVSFEETGIPLYLIPDLKSNLNAGCISTNINKQLGVHWRIWTPELFSNIAYDYNSNSLLPETAVSTGTANLWNFTLINEENNPLSRNWKGNNEIQFLFQIGDGTIKHEGAAVASADPSTETKLYAFWIPEEKLAFDDFSFMDLWSFSINSIKKQRGGVTILNNVINATVKEQTVIEVDMPNDGLLNVFIMTLDGNIIKRLSKGQKKAGTHYFKWDGTNNAGKTVARGLYFVRVSGKDIDETRKVMVVKD